MNNQKECCFCKWPIPAGKGNTAVPADLTDGAVCCNWCKSHIVDAAEKAIHTIINENTVVNGVVRKQQDEEKQKVND